MSTWRFPTLADVPRASWPATLVVRAANPSVGGDVDRVYCGCKCFHTADEIFDLRGVSAAWQAANSVTLPAFTCTHCFHQRITAGKVSWGGLARALGCTDAVALASFDHTDTEGVAQGFLAQAPVAISVA